MNQMKKMIEQKLIANVIMDKCEEKEHILFQSAWCSQERILRFATIFWKKILSNDMIYYEAINQLDSVVVNCICYEDKKVLNSWDITNKNVNELFAAFDKLLDYEIPAFEKAMQEQLQGDYVEGKKVSLTVTKYERNKKARAACLACHGYTCKICGMNFEEVYGPEFKNIIEVHHLVPLSQIGTDYIVDPIKDLIPVCPNCHTALHSKDGMKFYEKYKEQK